MTVPPEPTTTANLTRSLAGVDFRWRGLKPFLRRHERNLQAALLWLAGASAIVGTLVVALAHLSDWAEINHVAGAWIALTKHASEGRFYPSLYDGQFWGGTRFMPLSILWNLGFTTVTQDYLLGTKLASLVATVFTLTMAYLCMRRLRCSRPLSIALVGAILLTRPGFVAATHPFRGDIMPVGLQLAALLTVAVRDLKIRTGVIAGLFCLSAVLFKVTAGWGCIAIGLTLLFRNRAVLLAFCLTFFVGLGGAVLMANGLTDGRFAENLSTVASADAKGLGALLAAPGKLNFLLMREAIGVWFLGAFVLFWLAYDLFHGRASIYQLAFVAAAAILVIILSDPGALTNHLIDVAVLIAIGVADLAGRDSDKHERPLAIRAFITIAVLWSMLAGFDAYLLDPLKMTLRGEPFPAQVGVTAVSKWIEPDDRLLSEHPGLPVVLQGRAPVMLDAYMMARIDRSRPDLSVSMTEQIQQRRFDKVILLSDPRDLDDWYLKTHFGERLIRLILKNYEQAARAEDYFVYVPRRDS